MTEYINKEKLIKAIEDKRPLNWNDTEAELAEQRAYDDIVDLIKDFDEGPCIVTFEGGEGYTDEQGGRRMRLVYADKILEDVYPVEIMIVDKIRNAPTVDFGVDIDRLKELAEADKEGRCLVLPCKEGKKVYKINFHLFEGCPPEIYESVFHVTDYYGVGNTVFFTKEEAKKALEGLE